MLSCQRSSSTTKITSEKEPVELGNVLVLSKQELAKINKRKDNFFTMSLVK